MPDEENAPCAPYVLAHERALASIDERLDTQGKAIEVIAEEVKEVKTAIVGNGDEGIRLTLGKVVLKQRLVFWILASISTAFVAIAAKVIADSLQP